MDDKRAIVKSKELVVEGSKTGRPKKRWKEVVEKDMLVRRLKRTDAQDGRYRCLAANTCSPILAGKTSRVLGG